MNFKRAKQEYIEHIRESVILDSKAKDGGKPDMQLKQIH